MIVPLSVQKCNPEQPFESIRIMLAVFRNLTPCYMPCYTFSRSLRKGKIRMQNHCSACGAPITDNAQFCSHCGARLPDAAQTIEIRYEDAAKLEEVRLKHESEERQRQEKLEARNQRSKALRIKRWVSWLLCICFLCVAMLIRDNRTLTGVFGVLFFAAGIYAVIITAMSVFKRR